MDYSLTPYCCTLYIFRGNLSTVIHCTLCICTPNSLWWTSIDEGVGGSVHSHSHSDLSDFSDYFDDDDDLSLPGS